MGKTLIIVESPTKAKTIGKYLGRNYTVMSSMGHVRDLPKSTLGVYHQLRERRRIWISVEDQSGYRGRSGVCDE